MEHQRRLNAYDADGDGQLDRRELAAEARDRHANKANAGSPDQDAMLSRMSAWDEPKKKASPKESPKKEADQDAMLSRMGAWDEPKKKTSPKQASPPKKEADQDAMLSRMGAWDEPKKNVAAKPIQEGSMLARAGNMEL